MPKYSWLYGMDNSRIFLMNSVDEIHNNINLISWHYVNPTGTVHVRKNVYCFSRLSNGWRSSITSLRSAVQSRYTAPNGGEKRQPKSKFPQSTQIGRCGRLRSNCMNHLLKKKLFHIRSSTPLQGLIHIAIAYHIRLQTIQNITEILNMKYVNAGYGYLLSV